MKYRSLTRKGTKTVRPNLNVVDGEEHDNDSDDGKERAPNLVIQPMAITDHNEIIKEGDPSKVPVPLAIEKKASMTDAKHKHPTTLNLQDNLVEIGNIDI